jgi:hypothetical protein
MSYTILSATHECRHFFKKNKPQTPTCIYPTLRTHHVETKHFFILQWMDDKFITFVETKSDSNCSDSMSKPTGRTKFYEHNDILSIRRPQYSLDQAADTIRDSQNIFLTSIFHHCQHSEVYKDNRQSHPHSHRF